MSSITSAATTSVKPALKRSLQLALREGAYDVAIKAATSLVYVVGTYLGRPQEAQWPAQVALDLAIGVDADPVTEARARNAMGQAYRLVSEWDASAAAYREGIRRLAEAVGERDSRVATLIGALGAVLTEAGRYDQARPELLRAYELRQGAPGAAPPGHGALGQLVWLHSVRARTLRRRGDGASRGFGGAAARSRHEPLLHRKSAGRARVGSHEARPR